VYEAEVVNTSNNSNTAGASLQNAATCASPAAAASSIVRVAVKVFDSSRLKEAQREAWVMEFLLGKLHYVQLLGIGMLPRQAAAAAVDAGAAPLAAGEDDLPCIVMELCDASLEGLKVDSEAEARAYVQPVLQAAAELHQGVMHSNGKVAIMRHRCAAG
jgi:hypothetical protein